MTTSETTINRLFTSISQLIPDDMNSIGEEVQQNLKSAMIASLKNMDLVTREEFDIQSRLLARTRSKLEEMERSLLMMEAQLKENQAE